jgi:hypothetical protein
MLNSCMVRLSELMFVEAVRRYLETLPPAQTGFSGPPRHVASDVKLTRRNGIQDSRAANRVVGD